MLETPAGLGVAPFKVVGRHTHFTPTITLTQPPCVPSVEQGVTHPPFSLELPKAFVDQVVGIHGGAGVTDIGVVVKSGVLWGLADIGV
jgi:hypothetical protein